MRYLLTLVKTCYLQFPEPLKSPTRPWVDPLLKALQRSRTTAREVQLVHGGVHPKCSREYNPR